MLQTTGRTTILTAADGSATVYLGTNIRGYLVALIYRPGTMDTGADLTVTGETSGIPILTKTNLGTGNSFLYPRGVPTNPATGALGTNPASEAIPILNERIKVVVAQGGNALSGSIEAIYDAET